MKKIKFLIASMLGAIVLVFACVLGTKVNADTINETTSTETQSTGTSGNTYVFASSSVLSQVGTSNTSLNLNYGVFHIDGTKWVKKNNDLDICANATDSSDICRVEINKKDTQKVTLTMNLITSAAKSSNTGKAYLSVGSVETTLCDYSNYTSAYSLYQVESVVDLEDTKITIAFESKFGFKSISAKFEDISTGPVVDEEKDVDISIDGYNVDFSKLTGAEGTAEEMSNEELLYFYEPYGGNTDAKITKYVSSGTFKAIQCTGANYGLKFVIDRAATLKLKVGSTSNSKTSLFALKDISTDNVSVLEAKENSSLTTNNSGAGVYEVSSSTDISYDLVAGSYYMTFISGTQNGKDETINRGGRWYGLNLEYTESLTLNAKLQRQVTTDKTAIRFVGTLSGFDTLKLKQIDSLKYTIKVEGYKAFDKEISTVYTSIKSGNTTICAENTNTYYCSYLFTNLLTENNNKSLVGKNISAYLTVKLLDGTTIKTNSVGYTIVAA